MKKNTYFLAILLFVAALFSATDKLSAQSCNQVEILYTAPDCFERDSHDPIGGAGGQQKGCKEISVCVNQPYTYTSSITLPGWTFNWGVTGPTAVTINPNNTSPGVNIVWPQIGVYTLTLTATDPSGNVFTYCFKINVKEKPNANFTFSPNNVCAGSWITFTGSTTFSGSFMSSWNFGDIPSGNNNYASVSGNTPVTHQYNAPGTYTVTLITYSFVTVGGSTPPNPNEPPSIKTCCADTITKQVTIKPGTLQIECISTVCPGDTVKYHVVGCAGVTWGTVIGGTAIASTPTTITIVWGNGNPQGQIQATCPGGCTASVPIPIIPTNPVIVGNTSPCNTSTTSYTLPVLPGTFYTWTLYNTSNNNFYNNLINTYPDNNTVWINWQLAPPGTYTLTVNLENKHICCSSTGTLSITPSGKWKAMMDQTICTGAPGASLFTTPGPGTFSWTILPPLMGTTPPTFTGPSFNPIFPNPGVYTVQVIETANTYCNSGVANPQQVKITVLATMPPGIINGPDSVCVGSQHTYSMSTPAPPGYHYAWSITGGTGCFQPTCLPTAIGNSVIIQWTGLTGTISVVLQANGFPSCPSNPVIKKVYQATLGNITGTMNVCVDGNGYYTITGGTLPPGETITWSIDPLFTSLGTIIAGQGSNSITILWHGQPTGGPWGPVTLRASTGCGDKTLSGIMIYPKFSISITKTGTDICNGGVTLTANGAPGGSAYLWSPGGQITSSISGIITPGNYTVTATNPPPTGGGGCVAQATYEVVDPFVIIPTTCGVGFCKGTSTNEILGVIVVKPGVGPFTFQWYNGFFPGTAISGATTPTYTTPTHGNYSVVVTYGSCTRYLNYTVKKVCCPDVNHPNITSVVRNSCNTFTFTGTTPNPTGAVITWNFGNGVSMGGASGVPITYTYPPSTIPGDYCVTFCVGPPTPNPTSCTGNCDAETVRIPLLAAFTYKLGCNGCLSITNLTAIAPTSGAATVNYVWDFGDGSPLVTTTSPTAPPHCYTSPTPNTYNIILTVNYSDLSLPIPLSCSSADTQTVNWAPLAINVNPQPVCTGVQTTFGILGTPSFSIVSYTWAFGDGFTAYTPSSTHIYNTPGAFTVTLTVVDALGNTCTKTKNITVEPGIGPCPILPGYICPGGSATLTAPNVAGATYLWQIESSPGVWTAAPGANTGMTYSTTVVGFYHVVITGPAPGFCKCTSNKVAVTAVTKPKAIIAVAPSSKLCGPGAVTLSSPNQLPGYTSQWWNFNYTNNFGSGMTINSPTISSTTTINLVLTNEYGCSDTCSLVITVNPVPSPPVIAPPPGLCEGAPITLTETFYGTNITWNNGATTPGTTVVSAGIYTATYTNPVTGCSSSSSITIKRRPPTDLFPHLCDSISCLCRDSTGGFTIYAPKPLVGAFFSNYNIQWFFNGGPAGTGPTFSPAQTGTYHIIITDPITNCKDTSLTYSIIVPPCDTCDCKESHWGDIIMNEGSLPDNGKGAGVKANIANVGGNPLKLKCKNNYNLKCNQAYTFNASYICKDSLCPPKVTYSLQPPSGMPQTGTVAFSHTFTQNGVYILTLYGWCGNKICDSCVIDLTVKCDPCNCKESKWGDIIITKGVVDEKGILPGPIGNLAGNGPPKPKSAESVNGGVQSLKCNNSYTWPCNQPFTINASYKCKDSLNCPPKVTYSLQPPTGLPVTGTVGFSYTPTQNGTYILTLYGWCGDKICDSCVIRLTVSCECDCKGSKWGEKIYSINGAGKPIKCMKPTEPALVVKCNDVITVNANYICTDANCPGTVTYTFTGPSGTTNGNLPLTFAANPSGTYSVTIYGWCGTTKCDSCTIRFVTECPPPECCPYKIKVDTTQVTSTYNQQLNATVLTGNFTISGLAGIPLTEVRADVLSYTITDNYNKECMKCVNLPYSWASVQSAGNLGTPAVPPKITMYNSTVHPFNPTGAGVYQNPREVVWNNGNTFIINNGSPIGMNFLLPPPPAIDCCEFKGKICVKFTFRDDLCQECEVVVCFEFVIKSKKPF